jgi:hypothetical protein
VQPGHAVGIGRKLPDVQRHQVPVLDAIAEPGQPQRVPSGTAPDVGDQRRRGRQEPQDDRSRPDELQQPPARAQPVALLPARIVRRQLGQIRILHDPSP